MYLTKSQTKYKYFADSNKFKNKGNMSFASIVNYIHLLITRITVIKYTCYIYCYAIIEHATRFSAIPAEPGCNVCVRTYCCYFDMKDNYVTLVTCPRLIQIDA